LRYPSFNDWFTHLYVMTYRYIRDIIKEKNLNLNSMLAKCALEKFGKPWTAIVE